MGSSHEDGYLIRTRISQDLQAAMLGITRQTLNKEMAELKRSGVIKKLGSHYWVKD
ncbi:MAG: helix-turn-helix domain-containing protein [Ketobacter sp.]